MQDKKAEKSKTAFRRIEDKGFYIILSLCVLAIGISGYVLFVDNETQTAVSQTEKTLNEITQSVLPEVQSYKPTPPKTPVIPEKTEETETEAEVQTEEIETVTLPKAVMPVDGETGRGFSGATLLFDKTMRDYRTHNGTDFLCTQGDSVFCMRDGKVSSVTNDGLFGVTVKVAHADGIESAYSGLSDTVTLKEGDEIKMGEAVGTAGNTAIGEINEPYHIHVSVTQNGKYIDLMSLFE